MCLQGLPYFCVMMRRFLPLLISFLTLSAWAINPPTSVDNIIQDIYSFLAESDEVDYEELQEHLLALTEQPINLNEATYDDLAQLRFLSDQQIDAILLYVYQHPMDNLYELRLVEGLQDYEIRDLLPFVCVEPIKTDSFSIRNIFRYGHHELTARIDGRYLENPKRNLQSDPIYTQFRYRFLNKDHLRLGFTLQRPTGLDAHHLLYGGYLQLKNISCIRSLVIGNYQASFGQGLVAATPFRFGKSRYVLNAGTNAEGIKYHSSVTTESLHGIGSTIQIKDWNLSGWYSYNKDNDTLHHHLIGLNTTYQKNRFKIGLTLTENLYTDSVHYYRNTEYNQHYFRGTNQFVGGINFRYVKGIGDYFGEMATTQNLQHWGYGTIIGSRLTPISNLGLIVLYRYYSPYFDNSQGYAFSETTRINDENGLYFGIDYRRLSNWQLSWYGDIFYFEGKKYSINFSPSWGFDTMAKISYLSKDEWKNNIMVRAKLKGKKETYSARFQYIWENEQWRLLSEANANLVRNSNNKPLLTYAYSLSQDIQYSFLSFPIVIQTRLQGFRALYWDNRIYQYENDVLYAQSMSALYGLGGRVYINFRWKIIDQLSLYFRISETIYAKKWVQQQQLPASTRTDIHLLLKANI